MAVSARKIALDVLLRCEKDTGYSNLALDAALTREEIGAADRALVTELVFGVIERKITLDHCIAALSSKRPEKLEPVVLGLIRLGLYQIIYLDRVPNYAAVNESVNLAPKRARGFVNAILRSFMRQGMPSLPDDPIEAMSVKHSYPVTLCELFCAEFGADRAESVLEAMNSRPAPTFRVNTLKADREGVISELKEQGIDARASERVPSGILTDGGAVARLKGLHGGRFFVQDEASQLCCEALGAKEGDRVLDICAAPGSKSFGAAINMHNKGQIISFDLHKSKLSLIEKGAKRLGIDIIEVREGDGRVRRDELVEWADRVICDVPCSGYGVIAKKPEIRYKNPEETEALPEIQYAILENCSAYVKPGGTLVYSTCTVLDRENGANVKRFLDTHSDFYPEGFKVCGREYAALTTLMPDADETDGFFIARLRRKSAE
ncbi:MAG: 16S rRNA (cytosine(967)-C(5))-methyltransferase RsmB [Clostridia bacterium]|nr:16S rRNA (cytosine(967)-C(5))-methyltransferase RsmB [Clostridia bacterium]